MISPTLLYGSPTVVFTFNICDVHSESIALLQYPLPPSLDELVKSHRKLRHALSQVVESKINAR